MKSFNVKLRDNKKKIIISSLNTNSIKIKFKLKGLYKKNIKFASEVSFKVVISQNNIKLFDVLVHNLEQIHNLLSSSSSSSSGLNDIYKVSDNAGYDSESSLSCDGGCINKIYNYIKLFIKSTKFSVEKKIFNSVIFSLKKNKINKINKINIRGYVRKL
jgi:hypothetical protein